MTPSGNMSRRLRGDIQTNPPATNSAVAESSIVFDRQVDQLPSDEVLAEMDKAIDFAKMEEDLMEQGIAKFAKPQHELLALIAEKRTANTGA